MKRANPAVRRKSKGSYRDKLADANRFGGKRPERKVVKTIMTYPPVKVYNDGSEERVKPSGKRSPYVLPRRPKPKPKGPKPDLTLPRQPKRPKRKPDYRERNYKTMKGN